MQHQTQTKSVGERKAALEATIRSIRETGDRELAALRKQTTAVNERVRRDVEGAEQQAARTDAQLADSIAAEFHAAMAEHVTAWLEEPSRRVAMAIADVFRRFHQRSEHELGAGLWDGALAAAFATELIKAQPNAANQLGSKNWGSAGLVELLGGFRRSLANGPAHIETAIAAVESELHTIAGRASGEPSDELTRRLKLMSTCATSADATRKSTAFDAEVERKRQEAFAQTYVPPEPLPQRALRAIGL